MQYRKVVVKKQNKKKRELHQEYVVTLNKVAAENSETENEDMETRKKTPSRGEEMRASTKSKTADESVDSAGRAAGTESPGGEAGEGRSQSPSREQHEGRPAASSLYLGLFALRPRRPSLLRRWSLPP